MLRRASQCLFLVALATLPALPAHSASFDLIFADSIVVVATTFNSGFTNGNNIALLVNTGSGNIGEAELSAATITAQSSDPAFQVQATLLNTGAPATPILPGEAVGTLLPGSPLLAEVLPGETVRNVYPIGLFWLLTGYPIGYTGTVVLTFTMTLGSHIAHYYTLLTMVPGPEFSVDVIHAGRTSGVPIATASRASSWGAIKRLYR